MNLLASIALPWQTVLLLVGSNVFMTFAWYGHLKNLATAPWYIAALVSWGIALLYLKEPFKLDYLWAALCLLAAVYFIFRNP